MTTIVGQEGERAERLRRARHLRDAIADRAQERGDTPAQIARVLDMSVGHWYRLKKDPAKLSKLALDRVEAVARYISWPRVQVMVALGWLQESELGEVIPAETAVAAALQRLERSSLTNGLITPLANAADDHRVLIARLLLAAEGVAAAKA